MTDCSAYCFVGAGLSLEVCARWSDVARVLCRERMGPDALRGALGPRELRVLDSGRAPGKSDAAFCPSQESPDELCAVGCLCLKCVCSVAGCRRLGWNHFRAGFSLVHLRDTSRSCPRSCSLFPWTLSPPLVLSRARGISAFSSKPLWASLYV